MMPIAHANNIDISYVETGKGEVIVFLHGYTGSTEDWVKQISFLTVKVFYQTTGMKRMRALYY